MAMPKWATPERRNYLAIMGTVYKGRCLKGHLPCFHYLRTGSLDHFTHRTVKVEVSSGPVTSADVRAGRAIAYESRNPKARGMGRVDLAQVVSGGDAPRLRWDANNKALPPAVVNVIGPKRVAVQHEELSDLYLVESDRLIESWKQDGRDLSSEQRQEAHRLAPTGEVGTFVQFSTGKGRRRLDPIEMDNHVANRPRYYLMGYGVDDQLRRFAKVRIPGTRFILQVDVSQSVQAMGRNKRRNLRRKGVETNTAEALIQSAVTQWWAA